ncbi:MAG TPA: response regulator [Clostridiaceae bacterium]|nr:response regulator [Clostridiaceae bacterium]
MTIDDKQTERLMTAAQKVFFTELREKVRKMKSLLSQNGLLGKAETGELRRFFHSIKGTASTLGLGSIYGIGDKWEEELDRTGDDGLDSSAVSDIFAVLEEIEKLAYSFEEKESVSDDMAECADYVNTQVRGKILIIDDDTAVLKLLENAFTLEGYKVYICDDSVAAMENIAAIKPNIIILDIMMPEMNGYEILEKIRSKPEYADIYIIILSSKSDVADRIQGIKAGADDYITKPFAIGEAIARVEMIMRRSKYYKEKLLKDCLTGAYSRYYFNLRISEETERYRRSGTIFSIALLDMDHYKEINDQFGHYAGDLVLKELAAFIGRNIRKSDSIYRYGGDEFIIIFPGTDCNKAYEIIERLRKEFVNKPVSINGKELYVTFSAGIKQITGKEKSVEQLVIDADKAMYQAKKSGRNKVMIYEEEMGFQNRSKTLLIVDDENTILKLLKDKFTNIGYNVVTAEDGKSAVSIVGKIRPDVILLDLVLPDMDGLEVCKQIREKVGEHPTRIIVLSGRKEKECIEKMKNCGTIDYITKPFLIEDLEARVLKALNN